MKEHVIKPKVEKLFKRTRCVFTGHCKAVEMRLNSSGTFESHSSACCRYVL